MKCSHLNVGGANVIVCGRDRIKACVKCRAPSTKLCDWRIDSYHTCDAPICDTCTHSPAPDKDLCPKHAEVWKTHPANPGSITNEGSLT